MFVLVTKYNAYGKKESAVNLNVNAVAYVDTERYDFLYYVHLVNGEVLRVNADDCKKILTSAAK